MVHGTGEPPLFLPCIRALDLNTGKEPISNLYRPQNIFASQEAGKLDLLATLNQRHAQSRKQQSELDARIESYELAFRMQAAAPEAVDLTQETKETYELYGIGSERDQSLWHELSVSAKNG